MSQAAADDDASDSSVGFLKALEPLKLKFRPESGACIWLDVCSTSWYSFECFVKVLGVPGLGGA